MSEKDKKVYMPMGAGGLMRFQEDEKHLIKLKPEHVAGVVIGIVVLELVLKFLA